MEYPFSGYTMAMEVTLAACLKAYRQWSSRFREGAFGWRVAEAAKFQARRLWVSAHRYLFENWWNAEDRVREAEVAFVQERQRLRCFSLRPNERRRDSNANWLHCLLRYNHSQRHLHSKCRRLQSCFGQESGRWQSLRGWIECGSQARPSRREETYREGWWIRRRQPSQRCA